MNGKGIIVGVLCVVLLPGIVYAQKKTGISFSPAYQEIVLDTNTQEKDISFELVNTTNQVLTFGLSTKSFYQKDEIGTIGFADASKFGLASFVRLKSDSITVGPGETETIEATILNRSDLSPGGHYAALIATLVASNRQGETKVAPALSSLLFIRKTGGEQFNLFLKTVEWPGNLFVVSYPRSFTLLMQNEGNVHVIPYGEVVVEDIFGRTLYKGVINASSLFVMPNQRRYVTVVMQELEEKSFPLSLNKITIKGNDSLRKVTFIHKGSFVYIHPGVIALVLLGGVVGIGMWRKMRA